MKDTEQDLQNTYWTHAMKYSFLHEDKAENSLLQGFVTSAKSFLMQYFTFGVRNSNIKSAKILKNAESLQTGTLESLPETKLHLRQNKDIVWLLIFIDFPKSLKLLDFNKSIPNRSYLSDVDSVTKIIKHDTVCRKSPYLTSQRIDLELKKQLQFLRSRSAFDPKHFYKSFDLTKFPKHLQIGITVKDSMGMYYQRVVKRQQRTEFTEEILQDKEIVRYIKKKYLQVQINYILWAWQRYQTGKLN